MKYQSVIGYGTAQIIEDIELKERALDTLMQTYSDNTNHQYDSRMLKGVTVIQVRIEEMTGKNSGY